MWTVRLKVGGAMERQLEQQDQEIEAIQAKLLEVQRAEKGARLKLGEARSRYNRVTGMLTRSRKKEAEAHSKEQAAKRKSEDTGRRVEDAHQRESARYARLMAESQRWDRDARRHADEQLRWQDESRRKEREVAASDREVRGVMAEVADIAKGAIPWEQRLKFLSQHRGRSSARPPTSDSDSRPLSITGRAIAALKQMLDSMEHRPDQALRLRADADGKIALSLDAQRQGDSVVRHEDTSVLFIDPPVARTLQGRTLDVGETPGGSPLMLSS